LTATWPLPSFRVCGTFSGDTNFIRAFMGRQKLSPQGQRLRTIILTVPIIAATSGSPEISVRFPQTLLTHLSPVVLYKRLVLGEPQRKLPRPGERDADRKLIEFHHDESSSSNDPRERQ